MDKLNYDRKRTRRAMLLAPAVGLLGVIPFVFQLNLSFMQFVFAAMVGLVASYVLTTLFGTPGYLLLRYLGYLQTRYLMAYAVLLVVVTPFLFDDIYAAVTFGPPILLVAGAFCYLRGATVDAGESGDAAQALSD